MTASAVPDDRCLEERAKIYVQYVCEHAAAPSAKLGLAVTTVTIIVSLAFLYIIYYVERKSRLDYAAYESRTTSLSDFSV